MRYEIKKSEGCLRVVSVEVVEDEIKEAYDSYYMEKARSAKIPGFRTGKAPLNIVKNYYEKSAKADVLDRILNKSYYDVITKEKISPIFSSINFRDIDFSDNKLTYEVEFEVRPDVDIKDYKGIDVEVERVVVEDKEIDDFIERYRENLASFSPVEDRGVKDGDYILCDMKIKEGDAVIEESNGQFIEVSSSKLLPGIADALYGVNGGDFRSVEVDVPKDYFYEKLKGKKVIFEFNIKEIKEKKLPEIDKEFLKNAGDFKSSDEFRESVRKDIEATKKGYANEVMRGKLVDKLSSKYNFPLPKSYIDRALNNIVKDEAARLVRDDGKSMDEVNEEELKKDPKLIERAEAEVKRAIVIDEIGELENIDVTDEDLENEYYLLSRKYKQTPETIKAYYEDDEGRLSSLKYSIRWDKIVDFLVENANVKEIESKK